MKKTKNEKGFQYLERMHRHGGTKHKSIKWENNHISH